MAEDESARFAEYVQTFNWQELSLLLRDVGEKRAEQLVLDEGDAHGTPPLTLAVQQGHLDICRQLLEAGADVTAQEVQTLRTPLHYALYLKNLDIFNLLLSYKPNLRVVDHRGTTVVHRCCAVKETQYLANVLSSDCPHVSDVIKMEDNEGATPAIIACQNDSVDSLQLLLDRGASVHTKDMHGRTALHHCVENSDTLCAELLLKTDPSLLSTTDGEGLTPLHMAVIAGNVPLIRLLLKRGASLQCRDQEEHTVAHWATVCGHSTVLDVLLEYGADLSVADKHQAYPVHYAAQMTKTPGDTEESGGEASGSESGSGSSGSSTRILKKLLAHKVSPEVRDKDQRTPIIWAASAGNAEACRVLVDAGADVNSADKDGLSALHCAASRGHADCVRTLVRTCEARVDPVDKNQCTPLFYATTLGHEACVKALLDMGADPNHTDTRGRTTAHCAAVKGSRDALEALGKEGVDLWKPTAKGDYPIHEAAQAGHVEVIEHLLQVKGDPGAIDTANRDGRTCLHIAALTNNLWLAKFLIDHKADVNAIMRNKGKNYTPYDAAVAKGNKEAADYLQSRGGRNASAVRPQSSKRPGSSKTKERPTSSKERPASSKERPKSGKDRPASGKTKDDKKDNSEEKQEEEQTTKTEESPGKKDKEESPKKKERKGSPKKDKDKKSEEKNEEANTKDDNEEKGGRSVSPDAVIAKQNGKPRSRSRSKSRSRSRSRSRSSSPKKDRSSPTKSSEYSESSTKSSPAKTSESSTNESKPSKKSTKESSTEEEGAHTDSDREKKKVTVVVNGDASPKREKRSRSPDKRIESAKDSSKKKPSPYGDPPETKSSSKRDQKEKKTDSQKKRERPKEDVQEEKPVTAKTQNKAGSFKKSASSNRSKETTEKRATSDAPPQRQRTTKQGLTPRQKQTGNRQRSRSRHSSSSRSRSRSSCSSRSSSMGSNASKQKTTTTSTTTTNNRKNKKKSAKDEEEENDGDGLNLFSDNEEHEDHEEGDPQGKKAAEKAGEDGQGAEEGGREQQQGRKRPRSSRLIAEIQDSVKRFEQERRSIRQLQQLRRAQIYADHTRNLALFHALLQNYGARHNAPTWDQMLQEHSKRESDRGKGNSKLSDRSDSKDSVNKTGQDNEKDTDGGRTTTAASRRRRAAASASSKGTTKGESREEGERRQRGDSPPRSPSPRRHHGETMLYREFQRQKTEDMRRLLIKAYRPALPPDLFMQGKPSSDRSHSPGGSKPSRPSTTKSHLVRPSRGRRPSFTSENSAPSGVSHAQYKAVQRSYTIMTPYGSRRIRTEREHHSSWSQRQQNGEVEKDKNHNDTQQSKDTTSHNNNQSTLTNSNHR